MQKALEQMNVKLTEVVSDVIGVTGMAIIQAEIARALYGNWRAEHLFALRQAVDAHAFYRQQLRACDDQWPSGRPEEVHHEPICFGTLLFPRIFFYATERGGRKPSAAFWQPSLHPFLFIAPDARENDFSKGIKFSTSLTGGSSMGRLHDRMAEDLRLRNFSPATRRNYLLYARKFVAGFEG